MGTKEYALYVESGPKQRKTMVHVLELLGCTVQGPATEEALASTPETIREYLRFLRRHGEPVEPESDFSTTVVQHVMEGSWLGNGDPTPGFRPDFEPLSADELKLHLRRLSWMQADFLAILRDVPPERLAAKPETARSIHSIVEHVAGSHCVYVRYTVGKVDGLSQALKAVEQVWDDGLPLALSDLWQVAGARLEAMTETEREQTVPHGQVTWTVRRGLRRMLEHNWEHLLEISYRVRRLERYKV